MSQYAGEFNKEFLKRTEKILQEYNGEYEITLLLNCTLSLICLPIELLKNENYEVIDAVCNKLNNLKTKIEMRGEKIKENENYLKLRALRNGIAHLNISLSEKENKIENITIKGTTNYKKTTYIFEFTCENLKVFCKEMIKLFCSF